MSAATIEQDLGLDPAVQRTVQPRRTAPAPARPVRGSGRRHGPQTRPAGAVEAPVLRLPRAQPRSCAVVRPRTAPSAPRASNWRLTGRGIAVVLVIGAMIALAALSVVGLTAVRVTSEHFQASSSVSV